MTSACQVEYMVGMQYMIICDDRFVHMKISAYFNNSQSSVKIWKYSFTLIKIVLIDVQIKSCCYLPQGP